MLSTAALVLLIPTLATALPAVHQHRNRTLLARDGGGDMNPSIIVNKDGNIVLDFQDGMLNDIDTPPSKILDQLHKQCDQFGCGATPFTVDVKVLNKQLQLDDAKITVNIQQAHYDGNLKDNLISTLQSGGDAVAKTEQKQSRDCLPSRSCLDSTMHDFTAYSFPTSFAVYHGPAGQTSTDWINVGLSLEVNSGVGFCGLLSGLGGAAASAVDNGAAGAGFSLLGLACNLAGIS